MKRVFDWHFIVSLALLTLVAWLVWFALDTVKQRDLANERLSSVITLFQEQQREDEIARNTLIQSQQNLVAAQNRSLAEIAALKEWQQRLIQWLSRQNIPVPENILRPIVVIHRGPVVHPKARPHTSSPKPKATVKPKGKSHPKASSTPTTKSKGKGGAHKKAKYHHKNPKSNSI